MLDPLALLKALGKLAEGIQSVLEPFAQTPVLVEVSKRVKSEYAATNIVLTGFMFPFVFAIVIGSLCNSRYDLAFGGTGMFFAMVLICMGYVASERRYNPSQEQTALDERDPGSVF